MFRKRKVIDEEKVEEVKSKLLSKFESMEESSSKPVPKIEDTAQVLSADVGTRYLERRMTEEIVLWKKVYSSHQAEQERYAKHTQKIESLFSQINPDASFNIEFSNPQSIHDYEEIEERILISFGKELFGFLVASNWDTHVEVESVSSGTNVYISRLVDENILEGRDELIRTLAPIIKSSNKSYEIFEKYAEQNDGREFALIGVKFSNQKVQKKQQGRIRSPRKDITV